MRGLAERHEERLLWAGNRGLYSLLQLGRHTGPIRHVPRLGWVVTDPLLARQVLNDPAHFQMAGEGGVGHLWEQLFGPEMAQFFGGEQHARLRAQARSLFTESSARVLVDRSQGAHYAELRDRLAAGEVIDVADATRVLAGRMVADLMGLRFTVAADDSYRRLFGTGERLASLALGTTASTDLQPAVVSRARRLAADLTRGVPAAYRTAGPDTILGRCRDMGLSVELTRGLATLLAIAGTETGASGTSRTIALLHDTGELPRLLADPSLIDAAVREGLRVTTPAAVIGRHVARDVELAGHALRAGDRIMLLTYLADNAVGPFDLAREYVPETRQLWFGAGRHLCLGAAVARLQIRRMIETLTATGRPYRVVSRRPGRRVLVPTYAALRVRAG